MVLSKQEIEILSPCERIALYIELSAKMAFVGARLRKLDKWSDDHYDEWDAVCDAVSICYFALSEEEWNIIDPFDTILSDLDRGIWPIKTEPNKETCFYCLTEK